MPKVGDGTTDAASRVHDPDQEPGYKKVKETREADLSVVDKFRSALERRKKGGDGPADSETNELVSKGRKSPLDRIGESEPSDRPMAREAADAPKEKDALHDPGDAGGDTGGRAKAAERDPAAPDDPGGAVDADAPPAEADQTGAHSPDTSGHRPQADPLAQQWQKDPSQSAKFAQMVNEPQSREMSRDADRDDPADAARIAEATGMTPIVPPAGNTNIEVSDVNETEHSRAHELTDKLESEILKSVGALRVSISDNQTKEVTVVLAQDVLPDTSFTVSFGNKGVEVKFQTQTSEVADKIKRVRGRLQNRLRSRSGLEVTIPVVIGRQPQS